MKPHVFFRHGKWWLSYCDNVIASAFSIWRLKPYVFEYVHADNQ